MAILASCTSPVSLRHFWTRVWPAGRRVDAASTFFLAERVAGSLGRSSGGRLSGRQSRQDLVNMCVNAMVTSQDQRAL